MLACLPEPTWQWLRILHIIMNLIKRYLLFCDNKTNSAYVLLFWQWEIDIANNDTLNQFRDAIDALSLIQRYSHTLWLFTVHKKRENIYWMVDLLKNTPCWCQRSDLAFRSESTAHNTKPISYSLQPGLQKLTNDIQPGANANKVEQVASRFYTFHKHLNMKTNESDTSKF